MYDKSEHYALEKRLAERLRTADATQRKTLYKTVYDQLFASVPCHPQLAPADAEALRRENRSKKRFIANYAGKTKRFIEFGCGDGAFIKLLSQDFAHLCGLDCSESVLDTDALPRNVTLVNADCTDLSSLDGTFDVAFSANLIEHLHPEDAKTHLASVLAILDTNGVYMIVMPNLCGGPNDISRDFDDVPTGLHLNECTAGTMIRLLREAGFRRVTVAVCASYKTIPLPAPAVVLCEKILLALPHAIRKALMRQRFLRPLNQIRLTACK